jgi:hypothetical protein
MLRTISCIELRVRAAYPPDKTYRILFWRDLNRAVQYVIGFYNVLVCQFFEQQDIDIIIYRFVSQINSRFHFGYVIVNPQSFSPFITASEFISK